MCLCVALRGSRVLLKPKTQLVAIHQARYFKRKDGLALGPGAFIKGLEFSAGVQALVVGKPSADFFRAALDGVEPEAAVMIGDVSCRASFASPSDVFD